MRKKLSISLPMLATVSLVVMPAVARAAPHYYLDGIKAPEGKTYPTLLWGTLTLANSNMAIQPLSCENAAIGEYRNPMGGGSGEGATDQFATTDCADAECPEEDGLEFQIHAEALPWASILVESGTRNLVETKAATVVQGCYEAHTSTLVAAPTTCKGNSDPDNLQAGNGDLSQIVSKVNFTGESDKLECVTVTEGGEVKTEGITEKSLNVMAYGTVPRPAKEVDPETSNTAQETLEVKNP